MALQSSNDGGGGGRGRGGGYAGFGRGGMASRTVDTSEPQQIKSSDSNRGSGLGGRGGFQQSDSNRGSGLGGRGGFTSSDSIRGSSRGGRGGFTQTSSSAHNLGESRGFGGTGGKSHANYNSLKNPPTPF